MDCRLYYCLLLSRYTMAAQDLVMRARGVLRDRGWRITNERLGSGDDISAFIIPLMYGNRQPWGARQRCCSSRTCWILNQQDWFIMNWESPSSFLSAVCTFLFFYRYTNIWIFRFLGVSYLYRSSDMVSHQIWLLRETSLFIISQKSEKNMCHESSMSTRYLACLKLIKIMEVKSWRLVRAAP